MLIAIVAAQDEFKQFLASKWFIELLLAIIATQLIEEAILTFSIDKVFFLKRYVDWIWNEQVNIFKITFYVERNFYVSNNFFYLS